MLRFSRSPNIALVSSLESVAPNFPFAQAPLPKHGASALPGQPAEKLLRLGPLRGTLDDKTSQSESPLQIANPER